MCLKLQSFEKEINLVLFMKLFLDTSQSYWACFRKVVAWGNAFKAVVP